MLYASTDLLDPLAIRLYCPSLPASIQGYFLYRHRVFVYRF